MEIVYYAIINLCAFLIMGWDKRRSIQKNWRIPEKHLLFFPLLGGAPGILLGMYAWKHKTKKHLFYIGVPLLYLIHRFAIMPVLYNALFYMGNWW